MDPMGIVPFTVNQTPRKTLAFAHGPWLETPADSTSPSTARRRSNRPRHGPRTSFEERYGPSDPRKSGKIWLMIVNIWLIYGNIWLIIWERWKDLENGH